MINTLLCSLYGEIEEKRVVVEVEKGVDGVEGEVGEGTDVETRDKREGNM